MRLAIVSIGSLGDVLPYVGLGQHLAAAGHQVTIATHGVFSDHVTRHGLDVHALPMDPRSELTEDDAAQLRHSPLSAARTLQRLYEPWVPPICDAIDKAAQDAEMLLLSAMAWPGVHSAEGRGIGSMGVYLQPFEPTSAFAPPAFGRPSLGSLLNRSAGRKVAELMAKPYMSAVNEIRSRYGLPAVSAREHVRRLAATRWPVLHGFSRHVVPKPADWRAGLDVVGYWWPPLPPGWRPPTELVDFIESGPAPVYIGFGSTIPLPSGQLSEMVTHAIREAGIRAVVTPGWARLAPTGDDVYVVDEVPHAWLFGRVSAAVHHAGAGTSAAALRAGIPSVPVPVAVDQPFWADRLARAGVATDPVPARDLTRDRLVDALRRATTDPAMRERSLAMSSLVRAESGAVAVAEHLHRDGHS